MVDERMKRTLTFEELKALVLESELDWVYIDGVDVVGPPGQFGSKRYKQWFFSSPQEALQFAKDRRDAHDGSSAETIRHAFSRIPIRTKDPDESWRTAIDEIRKFTLAKTIQLDLGDLGKFDIPTKMNMAALKARIKDFITREVEKWS